jgi:hypothetical protein
MRIRVVHAVAHRRNRAEELEDRAQIIIGELAELEPEHGAGERPAPRHAAGADRLDEIAWSKYGWSVRSLDRPAPCLLVGERPRVPPL